MAEVLPLGCAYTTCKLACKGKLSRRFCSRDLRALCRGRKTLSHSCKLQGGGAKEKRFTRSFMLYILIKRFKVGMRGSHLGACHVQRDTFIASAV